MTSMSINSKKDLLPSKKVFLCLIRWVSVHQRPFIRKLVVMNRSHTCFLLHKARLTKDFFVEKNPKIQFLLIQYDGTVFIFFLNAELLMCYEYLIQNPNGIFF